MRSMELKNLVDKLVCGCIDDYGLLGWNAGWVVVLCHVRPVMPNLQASCKKKDVMKDVKLTPQTKAVPLASISCYQPHTFRSEWTQF
jgi:hypothetical protein